MLSALLETPSQRGVTAPCLPLTPSAALVFYLFGVDYTELVPTYYKWPRLPIMCYYGPDSADKRNAIRMVLTRLGGDVEVSHQGWTPLITAAYNQHVGIAIMLIDEFGADVHAKTSKGFDALYYAVTKNCPALTEALILRGAVADTRMRQQYAYTKTMKKTTESVALLWQHGLLESSTE